MEREWKKSNSLFACSQYGVVYNVLLYIQNVQWAGLCVLIGFTNVRMLLLVSALRIEQMLTIDPCTVCMVCKSGRKKHAQPNTLPQNAPIHAPISFYIHTKWKWEEKKVCCEHVALILFVFFLLFIYFLFGFYSHLPFIQCVFIYVWVFLLVECALCAWNKTSASATFYSAWKFYFAERDSFPFNVLFLYSYFAWWKFGRIEWLIWIEPIYVT